MSSYEYLSLIIQGSAVFVGLIVCIVYWLQLKAMRRSVEESTRAAKDSAEAATNALQMAHRPKLIVRHVIVDGFAEDWQIGTDLTNGHLEVINVGVLPATLLRVHAEWLFIDLLPIRNPALDARDTSTAPTEMPPGSFARIPLPDRHIEFGEFSAINNAVEGAISYQPVRTDGNLYVLGYIKYKDAIGLRRRYFLWVYDTAKRRFAEVEHPNYNYED